MAKAFEKVNPHWAVDVMLARGCPTWLVQYAMYLFTGRRVLHKVRGQLSRIIRQGVDMGRAFSVFMFCLAMDPIYWHLNKIPGITNVKGYVDDCTAVGQCQHDLAWLLPLRCLFTAGFQIIEHSCWKACVAVPVAQGYPTSGPFKALPNQLRYWAGHLPGSTRRPAAIPRTPVAQHHRSKKSPLLLPVERALTTAGRRGGHCAGHALSLLTRPQSL